MDSRIPSDRATSLRQSTVHILKACTRRNRSSEVAFATIADYAQRYVERYRGQYPQLEAFGTDVPAALREALADLARSGQCRLRLSGDAIERVDFPLFYVEAVREAYARAETSPEAPFPSEAALGVTIPNELITTVNVTTDLTGLVQGGEPGTPLVRLLLPESLRSIVVPSQVVRTGLLDVALGKLKHYLGQANNAAYVQTRLAPAYHGNQTAVADMISSIAMRVGSARQTIEDASDAHFRFWAQLTHVIVAEKKPGEDEAAESAAHQAAHLIGAYTVALRSAGQSQQNEIRASIRAVEAQFSRAPFVYTLKEIYALRDSSGAPVLKKGSQEAFLAFLKDKMRPPAGKVVPELIRLKVDERTESFVHRDRLIPVFLDMAATVAVEAEEAIASEWEQALRSGQKPPAMFNEAAFAADVSRTVQNIAPLFARLLDEGLLNNVQRETKPESRVALELSRCFEPRGQKLKPVAQILGLERKALLARARAAVPLWMRNGVLRAIAAFFGRILAGWKSAVEAADRRAAAPVKPQQDQGRSGVAAPEPAEAGATTVKRLDTPTAARSRGRPATLKQRTAVWKRDLERLRDRFAGSRRSLAASLEELAEQWNPLVEPRARTDLKQDVDSMTRSFMRGIMRHGASMKAPDAERIASLAQRLSGNPAFDRIRRKDLFVRYVELMMIKVLADEHGVSL